MSLSNWSDQQIIAQLNTGQSWSGSTITYSFPTSATGLYSGNGQASGFSALTAAAQEKAALALSLWDDLIAPDMVKVAAGSSYTTSNIEYGMSSSGVSYGYSYYPSAGSVWFNSAYSSGGNNLVSPEVGRHGFMTYIHETGHALGLDHMDSGSSPSCYQDSTVYSLMSCYGPNFGNTSSAGYGQVAWADWVAGDGILHAPQTPMMNDIKAIQAIYGAETNTRTGDTIYGFHTNITDGLAAIFDFNVNKHPILCIYDSAGIDTLDLSGFASNSTINLAPGSFSHCDNMTYNVSIAANCLIENATGGSGADTITGNMLSNTLVGNAGNDTLSGLDGNDFIRGGLGNDTVDGGSGSDTVYFEASWSALTYTYDASTGSFSFTSSADGTDTVKNIEYFVDSLGVQKSFAELTSSGPSAPEVSIAGMGPSVIEGDSGSTAYSFTVSLSAAASTEQMVDWSVDFGSSQASLSDFSGATNGTIQIAAGATSATLTVYVAGDLLVEGNESFVLKLGSVTGGATIGSGIASGLIVDDDTFTTLISGTDSRDNLIGTSGSDQLVGLGGNDTISGQDGDDVITGGTGWDYLTGGLGADTFKYNSVEEISKIGSTIYSDLIRDFVSGTDKIDLSALDASSITAGDDAFTWLGTAAIGTSSAGELRFEQFDNDGTRNDYTMIYGDTNSDSNIEFAIRCSGLINFTAADFVL